MAARTDTAPRPQQPAARPKKSKVAKPADVVKVPGGEAHRVRPLEEPRSLAEVNEYGPLTLPDGRRMGPVTEFAAAMQIVMDEWFSGSDAASVIEVEALKVVPEEDAADFAVIVEMGSSRPSFVMFFEGFCLDPMGADARVTVPEHLGRTSRIVRESIAATERVGRPQIATVGARMIDGSLWIEWDTDDMMKSEVAEFGEVR